jgi:putative glutamine amidotransferase
MHRCWHANRERRAFRAECAALMTVEHEAVGEVSGFHSIALSTWTQLSELAGGRAQLCVNSRHHRGLRSEHVALGLRVSALAPDDVVEGLEGGGEPFLVGIQFHPERPGEVPEMVGVFDALVASGRIA